jgi:hypothetical protein
LRLTQAAGLEAVGQVLAGQLSQVRGVKQAGAAFLLGVERGVRLIAAAPTLDAGARAQGADA